MKKNEVTIESEKGYVTSQTLSTSGYNGISDIVADLAKAESERRFPAVLV